MGKIKRILIANRGEIACRIIRTCKEYGIETVCIFSDADKDALFVKLADIGFYIGEANAAESYLNSEKIISAALLTASDAIHPGYGFLAENADFASKCQDNNLIFIGPRPEIIEKMGSKILARELAISVGVPIVTGFHGKKAEFQEMIAAAEIIGFPLLIKASAGGGGKGIRVVNSLEQFEPALILAKSEAFSSFADDTIFLEKYYPQARHIEIQIFGDNYGNKIHLFERECSIQRRFQKIIEETPANISTELRNKMTEAALKLAGELNYNNAGTVEFIVDHDENFYFLEINTRLQVEHPVTEMVTGLDLVKLQLDVAEGKHLPVSQDEIKQVNHAIECRICAEEPGNNFYPSIGQILFLEFPEYPHTRIDSGVIKGNNIDIYYDSMLAKIICSGGNRDEAIFKMIGALKSTVLLGVATNLDFLLKIMENNDFLRGIYDTSFISENKEKLLSFDKNHTAVFLIAALLHNWHNRKIKQEVLKNIPSGWRNNSYSFHKESFYINDQKYELEYRYTAKKFQVVFQFEEFSVELLDINPFYLSCLINDLSYNFIKAEENGQIWFYHRLNGTGRLITAPRFPEKTNEIGNGEYKAPLPGEINNIFVKTGETVWEGSRLLTINSMKMESTIYAHKDGTIGEIFVSENTFVESGTILLTFAVKE